MFVGKKIAEKKMLPKICFAKIFFAPKKRFRQKKIPNKIPAEKKLDR